jgi:hypothetical protein
MSEEEISSIWYSGEEYRAIKAEWKRAVDLVQQKGGVSAQKPLRVVAEKSVRFAPSITGRCIEHIGDMSKEEISSIWYSGEEYRAIKAEWKYAVDLVKKGGVSSLESSSFSTRGLERLLCPVYAALRRTRRQNAWNIVLDEQDDQNRRGHHYSPEFIAELYQEISARCIRDAQEQGRRDQEELDEKTRK